MGGDEIGYHIILRGFRVSVSLLDAYLAANGEDCLEDQGPCFPADPKTVDHPITKLLYKTISEVDDGPDPNSFRLITPKMRHYDRSKTVYIAYAWVVIYVQRELDMEEDLPQKIPAGFDHLRQTMLSVADQVPDVDKRQDEGKMGIFAVREETLAARYFPQDVRDRYLKPLCCDQCGQGPFPSREGAGYSYDFNALIAHRRDAHGLEEYNPLPEV